MKTTRTRGYRGILHNLIDMGADLARMIHQQAATQGAAAPAQHAPVALAHDLTIAFDRVARCVRRCIVLARKLGEPVPAWETRHHGAHRVAARKRIIREVEDAIQRTAGDAEAAAMQAELVDRLDAPELEDDIDQRPVGDIIADICRDLGLAAMPGTHPWKRRTPRDVAELCALAAGSRAEVPDPPAHPAVALPGAEIRAGWWRHASGQGIVGD